jgi:CubicO group peptidase (beta-lactamase class C family)
LGLLGSACANQDYDAHDSAARAGLPFVVELIRVPEDLPDRRADPTEPGAFGSDAPSVAMAVTTNCSEAGRGTTDFPVPASLGNGLVYDAMPIGHARRNWTDPLMPDVEQIVAERREKGFRPVQIDVKPHWDSSQGGHFRHDQPEPTLTLISDEDANHQIVVNVDRTWSQFIGDDYDVFLLQGGWRPLVVTPNMVDFHPSYTVSQRYSSIWVRDGKDAHDPDNHVILVNSTEEQIHSQFASYGQSGHRPISIEASTIWDSSVSEYRRQFAAVLYRDEIGAQEAWDYALELEDASGLMDDIADKANEGLVPFYISTGFAITQSGSLSLTESQFNVLYVARPPAMGQEETLVVEVEPDLESSDISTKNQEMLAQGYHLVSLARYRDPNDVERKLFVGTWHRYGEWVETIEGDATTEGEDFEPLEDAIKDLMAEHNIPAAQLAVIQGEDLVLSRAYTRAPVAYAPITTATPIMAGSITKPITAVAALQVIGLQQGQGQGQPGIEGPLMNLVPAPTIPGGTKPSGVTVRQALQHTSGWLIGASSLAVKEEFNEGRMPTSMDWLNYMSIQTNHGIDTNEIGNFNYSNFPYEMVALALKQEEGISSHDFDNEYESDLMRPDIFDEVGMCRTAYKRQGLLDVEIPGMAEDFREPEYAPCTAGSACDTDPRYYLTESNHPYAGATAPYTQLDNPAMFEESALDDAAPVPAYVRRGTYGGGNAVHPYIGSGSLVSTAEDLARFMASFRPFLVDGLATPLLTAAEASAMFPEPGGSQATQCFANGRVGTIEPGLSVCYGLGWYVGNEAEDPADPEVWWHGGDVEGAVTVLMYHPDTDATVAVLFARHPMLAVGLIEGTLNVELDAIAQ